jgi:hypothetical protein
MARVPDTTTFSMIDVINVVDPLSTGVDTLTECFTAASAAGFDSTYEGSKNSLYNFRNYFTLYADDSSFSWTATGLDYEATNVYTNSAPFIIDSKPAWITAAVYVEGVEVIDPDDYNSGYELRLTPSLNTGSARSGSVVLIDTADEFTISVSQSAGTVTPAVSCEVADGEAFTITDLGGSIDIGTDSLTFSFTDVASWNASPTNMPYNIYDASFNNVKSGNVAGVYNDPDEEWGDTVQISRNAVSGDVFTVVLGTAV